jgi:DNA-binding transcriptional MerR regulator
MFEKSGQTTNNAESLGDDCAPDGIARGSLAPDEDINSMAIGEFARQAGVTLRALRFYQSKGLLAPARDGHARVYNQTDRERLAVVLQGKRLGFTLCEIREMLAVRASARGCDKSLPVSRKKCVEQIKLLERQRRDIESALGELRAIYTGMLKAVFPAAGDPTSAF